jgi:hypothetical protein
MKDEKESQLYRNKLLKMDVGQAFSLSGKLNILLGAWLALHSK